MKFFDGLAIGGAYPGFVYDEETGARAIEMVANSPLESSETVLPTVDATPHTIKTYHNGGCAFVEDPSGAVPMTVLARYSQPIALFSGKKLEDPNPPAVVLTRPGSGYALLSGVHMEYDAALLAAQKGGKEAKLSQLAPELEKTEKERVAFFTACLKAMGLRVAGSEGVAAEESGLSPLPTRLHVTFADEAAASFVPGLLNKCSEDTTTVAGTKIAVFDDTAFQLRLLHDPSLLDDRAQLDGLISELQNTDLEAQREALIVTNDSEPTPPKPAINMLIHKPRSYPPPSSTPHFDIPLFHKLSSQLSSSSSSSVSSFASILAYSHVIPSTQTLIDKNFRFSQLLPDGFTAVATHQTAGRGRGRNSWVSPLGCLQFSLLLRHPREAPPVVFIQYLFALAVVEAVRSKQGCEELPVFIKWPNDVYAKVKGKDGVEELKKLGGILINSSFVDGMFVLVIGGLFFAFLSIHDHHLLTLNHPGHGLNVSNATPSTCLNTLLSTHAPHLPPFTQEETLALILHRFRILYYDHYLTGGFPAVEGRYRRHWIHQDQIVGVEGVEGKLKIRGINEGGELVVVKLDSDGKEKSGKENTLALTPDGNGFDMLRGLLVSKHTL